VKSSSFCYGLILFCTVMLASCFDMQREQSFSTTAEFKKSDLFNNWVPDVIPDGSEKIEVWHDIDTNDVRVQFVYRGPRPLRLADMTLLDQSLKDTAVSAYPRLGSEAEIISIQYECESQIIELDSETKETANYFEVKFVGDTGEKVYYWNTHLDETYKKICKP
jgi:hypothetical protein